MKILYNGPPVQKNHRIMSLVWLVRFSWNLTISWVYESSKPREENIAPLAPDECVAALFLSVFDSLHNPVYDILKQWRPESWSKSQTEVARNVRKLCWVFHCLLVHFPQNYTELISHFAIASQNGNNQLNLLDLIKTVPGSLKCTTQVFCLYFLEYQSESHMTLVPCMS